MTDFVYRLAALAIKFTIPLLILSLSSQAELGHYYLGTGVLIFVVTLIGLETAIPFAGRYLLARTEHRRRLVFSVFFLNLVLTGLALSAPVVLFCALHTPYGLGLLAWLPVVFTVELCVNEFGRFHWNVGHGETASRREVARAISLTVAALTSLWVEGHVVTGLSLSLLSGFNSLLLLREVRRFGLLPNAALLRRLEFLKPRRFPSRLRTLLGTCGPQVVQIQLISLQPLLERWLIERRLGMEMVGAFSFHYSLIQTSAALILIAKVGQLRRLILSESMAPGGMVYMAALRFLGLALALIGACAVSVYLALPVMTQLLGKHVSSGWLITTVAAFSGCTATFASAVSPLYAGHDRVLRANLLTVVAMLPLLLPLALAPWPGPLGTPLVLALIVAGSALQLIFRTLFFLSRMPRSPMPHEDMKGPA